MSSPRASTRSSFAGVSRAAVAIAPRSDSTLETTTTGRSIGRPNGRTGRTVAHRQLVGRPCTATCMLGPRRLGGRLMARRQPLELGIGVRAPAPQLSRARRYDPGSATYLEPPERHAGQLHAS